MIGFLVLEPGGVPMAIFTAFLKMHLPDMGASLIIMTVIALAARFGGLYVKVEAEEDTTYD